MLYYLHTLTEWFSPLRVFRYITFRAVAGAGTAFLLSVFIGPWVIRQLRRLKVGQQERKEEAPPLYVLHGKKEGTPTMGGLLIVATVTLSTLLWAVPSNVFILLTLATMCYMTWVGYLDDYTKITKKNPKGISARRKLLLQAAWAVFMGGLLVVLPETRDNARKLMVPFLKEPALADMGIALSILFVSLIIVGATNAVNLTDGLDGLAIGCSSSVALSYLVMAYVAGNLKFADYLRVPYIPGSGELAVFCGALLGAGYMASKKLGADDAPPSDKEK